MCATCSIQRGRILAQTSINRVNLNELISSLALTIAPLPLDPLQTAYALLHIAYLYHYGLL